MNSIGNTACLGRRSHKRWAARLTRALIIAAGCLFAAPPSMADTWDDAVAAHAAGDYATAFRIALELAHKGETRAQGLVGFHYLNGLGVEKNLDQAMKWLELASEQGDAAAQANLCAAFLAGNPDAFDIDKALYWCKLSAAQDYDAGMFYLGLLYYDLGRAMLENDGPERNMLEAYVWLSLAELAGRDPVVRRKAAKTKAEAKKDLTPTEIAEGDRRISAWRSARP